MAAQLTLDFDRLIANARRIKSLTRNTIYAVLKADAYGLGAHAVSRALRSSVDGFYLFDLAESVAANLGELGLPILALDHPWKGYRPQDYQQAKVRPIVHSISRAQELRHLNPVLSIDTGMHRFACPPADVPAALDAGQITEAMTHASRIEQVHELKKICSGRNLKLHAAASSLLNFPEAHLDAVRPGLTLYQGVATVTSPLVEVTNLPPQARAGYTQFSARRVGVILMGYTNGLKPGNCLINGVQTKILEVGMQSAFIELPDEVGPVQTGSSVTLLSPDLPETLVAAAWGTSPQEVLVRLCGNAQRHPSSFHQL